MASEAGLQVDYRPLAIQDPARWERVLGIAAFHIERSSVLATGNIPVADIRTPVLGSAGELCEIWRTRQPVESGQRARVQYRRGEDVLFGCISVPESDFQAPEASGGVSALQTATEQAYREIFATVDALACPHLLRIWNYLPQINLDTHGTERYRQFNNARRNAIAASGRELTGAVPAACALGSAPGSPLVIYFLASRATPAVVENPRQVSAYQYPPQYGPRPVFSRASVLREKSAATLFISGTASIVGHETLHVGDVVAQTRETLANIEALLAEANRVCAAVRFEMQALAYKVYVRHSADLPLIQAQLHAALGARARLLYLQADICRQDLLVEIEAIGQDTADSAA